jgi:hypothetical protein
MPPNHVSFLADQRSLGLDTCRTIATNCGIVDSDIRRFRRARDRLVIII